ncbi:hypothetical protein AYO22_05893 [Fonsecaea multimorphosa]|nr:hypothetical protein AYO22_05893 [Fonsecaea multimorphosa]
MPSSCKDIRAALAQCLQNSDCILVQRHTPVECLSHPLLETLPEQCQQLKIGFRECRRGLVDMRKRFRGNAPISTSLELEAGDGSGRKVEGAPGGGIKSQLYAGRPAFDVREQMEGCNGSSSGDEDDTTRIAVFQGESPADIPGVAQTDLQETSISWVVEYTHIVTKQLGESIDAAKLGPQHQAQSAATQSRRARTGRAEATVLRVYYLSRAIRTARSSSSPISTSNSKMDSFSQ